MNYDTVIFDLDGTLVNTLEDLTDSLNGLLEKEGYQQRSLDEVKDGIGEGYRVLLEKSLPTGTHGEEIDRCTTLFEFRYLSNMFHKTKPYEGILDLLKELKSLEIKIGVVSNKMDGATKDICRHYFGSLIDVAVGDTPGKRKKPAPDNVYEALNQLGSNKSRTIYVGDSNVDVHTASHADLEFVGVSWGFRSKEVLQREGAKVIIDIPGQLIHFL